MKKKQLLSLVLTICLTVGTVTTFIGCGNKTNSTAQTTQTSNKEVAELQQNNWSENNYKDLKKLIDENGVKSPNYDKNKKPYIFVDWDNTSIYNDLEETLMTYQLKNLEYKMTPEQYSVAIRKDIPKDNFVKNYNNKAGQTVNIDSLAADLTSDYKYLYENYKGLKGTKTLDEIKTTPQYQDFFVKTRYAYDAIDSTFKTSICYPWIIYIMLNGMNESQVKELSQKSLDFTISEKIGSEKVESPTSLQGKAGVVSSGYKTGLRPVKEMQNLYNTCMKNGIDVYVCSASFIDVVKICATNPKYGYNIPASNVYGMELERDRNGIIQPEYRKGYDQTHEAGKTATIKRFVADKRGYGPILVAGDSDGDVNMLQDFKDTKISLIINRIKGGEIGKLSKIASETIGKSDARYLLQGRNDQNGVFRPSEKSIILGQTQEKLIK